MKLDDLEKSKLINEALEHIDRIESLLSSVNKNLIREETFSREFKTEFLEVQNYITDPCGKFEEFCKKYKLPCIE